jgi:hypothetical protein
MNLRHSIVTFAARLGGGRAVRVRLEPLAGGLESVSVLRADIVIEKRGRRRRVRFVAKLLEGPLVREVAIYERLVASSARGLAPALLGVDRLGTDKALLYLEAVCTQPAWPWRDTRASAEVLVQLARLHGAARPDTMATMPDWDYEAVLLGRARQALATLEEAPRRFLPLSLLRTRAPLRRLVRALPRFRAELLRYAPFGRAVIHGDVHSGNVLLVRRGERDRPVFVDWARARSGSPLEDVSSWLQSLGCWEPEARRRHDSLLGRYLRARDLPVRLGTDLRAAYWLAAASNVLAGAFHYHLSVALAGCRPGAAVRADSFGLAQAWARVLRRADAFWSA